MRILIVEDDEMVAAWTRRTLTEAGYQVDIAITGEEGRQLGLAGSYDLFIIDLELPDRDGLTVVHALRRAGLVAPIVITTGRDTDEQLVAGLDAGADDYCIKPVPNAVLLARVRAAIRRGGATRQNEVTVGDVTLNRLARRVIAHGRELALTPLEYSMLELFMLRPGEIVPRTELLSRVWGMTFDPGTSLVDTAVSRLRQKLGGMGATPRLRTVRGVGHLLTA